MSQFLGERRQVAPEPLRGGGAQKRAQRAPLSGCLRSRQEASTRNSRKPATGTDSARSGLCRCVAQSRSNHRWRWRCKPDLVWPLLPARGRERPGKTKKKKEKESLALQLHEHPGSKLDRVWFSLMAICHATDEVTAQFREDFRRLQNPLVMERQGGRVRDLSGRHEQAMGTLRCGGLPHEAELLH